MPEKEYASGELPAVFVKARSRILLALGLAMTTIVAFEGVRRCDFVDFDDNLYVTRNPHLRDGLSARGLRWAFAAGLLFDSAHADYWTPLTAVSRMADSELFGLEPAGHHLVNLAFHVATAVVLLLVLEAVTGSVWPSAFVAAAFAVHPLHVESVTWISERKDVLSGIFFVLALAAYARYVRAGGTARYVAVCAFFALGLMAKPMVMTLPFVLLLLDYWPLARFDTSRAGWRARARALLGEKVPLLLLTAISLFATVRGVAARGELRPLETMPLQARLGNAADSYLMYLYQALWPHPLAVLYPYPEHGLPVWRVGAACVLLALITVLVVRWARTRPYLLVGWCWYLGMLLPVIGIVQAGPHARADRYVYLPLIGLAIMAAWGTADLAVRVRHGRTLLGVVASGLVITWTVMTWRQVRHWEDTIALFSHALEATSGNYVAHNNLAGALAQRGEWSAAELHYREALRIQPRYPNARNSLGALLARRGRLDEARREHLRALEDNPSDALAHYHLGLLEARAGRSDSAAASYREALRLNPGLAQARYNWGNLAAARGLWSEAEKHYVEAERLLPDDADVLNNLGLVRALQGRWPEAAQSYERALVLKPGHGLARTNLGRALFAQGRIAEAIAQYEEALRRSPNDAEAHYHLGVALAALGGADQAIAHYQEVLRLQPDHPDARRALAATLRAKRGEAAAHGAEAPPR